MQDRTPQDTTIADWSSNRQHATRRRTAVQHEVTRLLDALAPEKTPQRRPVPEPAVRAYRWPARCILQGAEHAVSVSWFPAGHDDDSLGEMLVIAWRGVVSHPGATRRAADEAVAVRSLLLHPEETGNGGSCPQGTADQPTDDECEQEMRRHDSTPLGAARARAE